MKVNSTNKTYGVNLRNENKFVVNNVAILGASKQRCYAPILIKSVISEIS